MFIGAAESAYVSYKAYLDGNGDNIADDYVKKTDLSSKQDALPYNPDTGIYGISAFGAAQAAWVPWSGVESKKIASADELGLVKVG